MTRDVRGENDVYRPRFSTKETWNSTGASSIKVPWYKAVWSTHSTPKYSFCVWLAVNNRLTTGDRMVQWNRGLQGTCTFCNNHIESRDHLFFSCSYGTEVWEAVAKHIYGARFSTNWQSIITTACNKWHGQVESFIARYVFQTAVYTIWRERNGRRHDQNPNPVPRLIKWIETQMKDQFSAIRRSGDRRFDQGLQVCLGSRN